MNGFRGQRYALAIGALIAMAAAGPALADPPAFSGIVERGTDVFATTWVDAAAGTRIVVGADILEYCSGVVNFDSITYQDAVINGRLNDIAWGENVTTSVWPFLAFDCNLFENIEPIATGTADWILPDNDLLVTGDQANAWGFNVRGFLATPDGARARVNAHQYFVVDDGQLLSTNSRIIINYQVTN
jgi:hypothetical protein